MGLEIAWFGALCDDDYEQLGVANESLRSSWDHCSAIVREAELRGFDSVLLPSGYELGLDTVAMASALARDTHRIRLLTAIRTGAQENAAVLCHFLFPVQRPAGLRRTPPYRSGIRCLPVLRC